MLYLAPACQGLLAVVFLASAGSKLRSGQALRAFASSLAAMRLVRGAFAQPVAVAVALAEAVVMALVAAPPTRHAGFAVAAALLAVLTTGVVVVLARGAAAPCRCFGTSAAPLSRRHLVRNVLLAAVAVIGLVAPVGHPPLAGAIIALLGGALTGLLVTALDDLVTLFAPASTPLEETRWRT
ncbi:MAG TPA: MauE/DoxX family redox-associated membrane protein [Micromonosporaceae bacterium]|nr:MauE/DoxX family redox-associated membrane protein [Micromonosporaceae bacterium]